MPVVRTDVRSVARAVYCHVITKFSRMMGLCTRALCARVELRYNMKQGASCMIMGYHSIVVWVESKVEVSTGAQTVLGKLSQLTA